MNMPINTANLKNNLTALAKNWVAALANRYKLRFEHVRSFRERYENITADSRGFIVRDTHDPEKTLYFVDTDGGFYLDRKSYNSIGELGIRKLNCLPKEGMGTRINPNEWDELLACLGDKVSNDIENAIRVEWEFPKDKEEEWKARQRAARTLKLG